MGALVTFKSNAEIDRDEQAQIAAMAPRYEISTLASHMKGLWQTAQDSNQRAQTRMMECLRRKKGEYSQQELMNIRQIGGSEIFMMITATKCRAAKAWLRDIFSPADDRPWSIEPTPIAELPPEYENKLMAEAAFAVQQLMLDPEVAQLVLNEHRDRVLKEVREEAEQRSEKMADRIEDMLVEGDWREAFGEFLENYTTFPSAFIEGPVIRKRTVMKWSQENGVTSPVMEEQNVETYNCIPSPDVYPMPATKDVKGSMFIRRRLTPADLEGMIGVEGYSTDAINRLLEQYGASGYREWLSNDTTRATLEDRPQEFIANREATLDAYQYLGALQGRYLLEFGVKGVERNKTYAAEVWMIANEVIFANINPNPNKCKRVYKASFEPVAGSFWGIALPERLADTEDACNTTARALMNNMSIGSGPQVDLQIDRLPQGYDVTSMYPWKIWQTLSSNNATRPAITFFQPQMHANELWTVYNQFLRQADDISGIPAYAYGSDTAAGAGKTASGLSMLMNATSKTIKDLVRNIDHGVIEPCIEESFNHLMLYDPDETIKGDCRVKARGSDSLLHRENAQMRRQELMQLLLHPTLTALIGQDGLANMLRPVLESSEIDADKIVPSEQELAQMKQMMLQQQMMAMSAPQGKPNAKA